MLSVLPGRDVTDGSWLTETFAEVARLPVTGPGSSAGPVVWAYTPCYSGNPFQAVLHGGFGDVSMAAAPAFSTAGLAAATAGWPADLPLVVHLHWLNRVLGRASSTGEALRALDAHRRLLDVLAGRGARLVWTVHNVLPHDSAFESLEVRLRQDVLDRAALVHVMSPLTAELVSPWFTLPEDRTYLCDHPGYQGVYPDWISRPAARRRLRIPDGATAFLLTGGLKPYKGLTELLDAVAVVAGERPGRVVLLVAGAPDDAAETRAFLDRCYLSSFARVLPGKVADADVQLLLRAADVVALPYRRSLNSGVLALALTFGRPVLLPSTSGCLPVVAPFPEAATVYDPGGGNGALAAALRQACDVSADPDRAAAAAAAAAGAGGRIDRAEVTARFAADLRRWADTGVVP